MSDSLDQLLLDAVRGVLYEPHEQHVDYEDERASAAPEPRQSDDSGGGRGTFSLLLIGVAFAAVGYALGRRSSSGGMGGGQTSIDVQDAKDKAAGRTQEMAESAADRIREGGEELSERTEATAGQASDRIEETSQEVGDQVEEKGSEASDEVEDSE